MIEQSSFERNLSDEDLQALEKYGIYSGHVERMLSLTAVIKFLHDGGYLESGNINSRVLDIGTGSGVGVFAWTKFGIPSRNITAIDEKSKPLKEFTGDAEFLQTDARKYLSKLPYETYDIISSLRIPMGKHDYTRQSGKGRKEWLYWIFRALKHNGRYVETYSEWEEKEFRSANNGNMSEVHLSFMGDTLDVPKISLCGVELPRRIRMGYPKGTYEENKWLDGRRWIPVDPESGECKKLDHRYYRPPGNSGYYGTDEYGVWAEQSYRGKFYPFGKKKLITLEYGYKDNLAIIYQKQA